MMAMLNTSAYLDRIGYGGPTEPSAATLRTLHRAHMLAVPFENLDVHRRPILCNEAAFLHKIIDQRRGGFCYELNGAFAALLRTLGFEVTLLSARVAGADGSYGPEFDHLTLRVDLPAFSGAPWLADVGFGDSFLDPLRLQPNLEQSQIGRVYRLVESKSRSESETESVLHLEFRAENDSSAENSKNKEELPHEEKSPAEENSQSQQWKRQYSFTLKPRRLADFAPMCRYHQTSPESQFTRQSICSRATPAGRITLSDLNLIETRNGIRTERDLAGESEWRSTLRELFKIDLLV